MSVRIAYALINECVDFLSEVSDDLYFGYILGVCDAFEFNTKQRIDIFNYGVDAIALYRAALSKHPN